jgi:hypothetical protein
VSGREEITVITTAMLTFKAQGTHWAKNHVQESDRVRVAVEVRDITRLVAEFYDVHAVYFSSHGELMTGSEDD